MKKIYNVVKSNGEEEIEVLISFETYTEAEKYLENMSFYCDTYGETLKICESHFYTLNEYAIQGNPSSVIVRVGIDKTSNSIKDISFKNPNKSKSDIGEFMEFKDVLFYTFEFERKPNEHMKDFKNRVIDYAREKYLVYLNKLNKRKI